MAKENMDFMMKTNVKGHPAYYLNLEKIVRAAKIKTLQGIIKRRFGINGKLLSFQMISLSYSTLFHG